jgi:cell division protein FtsZ
MVEKSDDRYRILGYTSESTQEQKKCAAPMRPGSEAQAETDMTLNLRMPEERDLRPRITVFGVGGAGGNAVNNMIEKRLEGVEFVVANTDAQALAAARASRRIQLGVNVTQGLGAGAKPDIGSAAAVESIEDIVDNLSGSHMCFITAGMGGGTGTGAAPIIARTAREMGILTVGVVTKPFNFEGAKRMRVAEQGIAELQSVVDTLIIIPNQNLFRIANEKTTFTEAFMMADDVLYQGVKGVTDLMVRPGIINLDFADVRSVMDEMGKAMMGTGEAAGPERAIQAAEKAIANPLLDEISLKGAKGVLINITGGEDLTLFELDEAANRIRAEVDPDANIIVGSTLDPEMNGQMRVSVVATGIEADQRRADAPVRQAVPLTRVSAPQAEAREPQPAPAPAPVAEPVAELSAAPPVPVFIPPQNPHAASAEPERRPEPAAAAPAPVELPVRRRGEPTPEAMERLRTILGRAAESGSRAAPGPSEAAVRAALRSGTPAGGEEKGALNRLIQRMTGHPAGRDGAERRQPDLVARPPRPSEEEQTRIDIPAFLRRQAN